MLEMSSNSFCDTGHPEFFLRRINPLLPDLCEVETKKSGNMGFTLLKHRVKRKAPLSRKVQDGSYFVKMMIC
jgi:hypothetical protein